MGGICSTRKTRNNPHTNESEVTKEVTNGYPEEPPHVAAETRAAAEVSFEVRPETYAREEGVRELCPEERYTEDYKRTFKTYYARLCDALCAPIVQILPELVSSEVITVHEAEEIGGERTSIEKARALLSKHIFTGISVGCPQVLEKLLSVMWHCSDHTCKALSKEICLKLNISPSSCE